MSRREWFDEPGPDGVPGLRFACTCCGNCCTGPEGFVLVSDAEALALARRLDLPAAEFLERYTRMLPEGRSLTERLTEFGHDCVFLDRDAVPGRAVCGVYEDRPAQCRTWPFWKALLRSPGAWRRARAICPGMDTGPRHDPATIRLTRERSPL